MSLFEPPPDATGVLDAVERWAGGCMMLRETGALLPDGGRCDALLIPLGWTAGLNGAEILKRNRVQEIDGKEFFLPSNERAGLVGVEVKLSIADFRKGLATKQYDRYGEHLAGLYVATPADVAKTRDVPEPHGHLVVADRGGGYGLVAVARRHPAFRRHELTSAQAWNLVWVMAERYRQMRSLMYDRQKPDERAKRAIERKRCQEERRARRRETRESIEQWNEAGRRAKEARERGG